MLFQDRFNTSKEKSFVSNVLLKFNSCLLYNHVRIVMPISRAIKQCDIQKPLTSQLRTKLRQCESIHEITLLPEFENCHARQSP